MRFAPFTRSMPVTISVIGCSDLDACVDFHEEEVPVLSSRKLHRADIAVANGFDGFDCRPARFRAASRSSMASDGVSSTSFWWRRWIEQIHARRDGRHGRSCPRRSAPRYAGVRSIVRGRRRRARRWTWPPPEPLERLGSNSSGLFHHYAYCPPAAAEAFDDGKPMLWPPPAHPCSLRSSPGCWRDQEFMATTSRAFGFVAHQGDVF